MSQILDLKRKAPPDYRPPICPGLTVVASPYRGYTDEGRYTNIKRNLEVAGEILAEYGVRGECAISLARLWDYMGPVPASDHETHRTAIEWCLTIVRKADALHLWYPMGMYLTRGMRLEWEEAQRLGISIAEYEREW